MNDCRTARAFEMTNRILDRSFREERGIAEVIDDLYRASAAPRDHDRLTGLVIHQLRHVYLLGKKAGRSTENGSLA